MAKELMLFDCHSKKLKLEEAEDYLESHSDESDLEDLSDHQADHHNVAQDQQNIKVSPGSAGCRATFACTSESLTSQVPYDIARGLHQ